MDGQSGTPAVGTEPAGQPQTETKPQYSPEVQQLLEKKSWTGIEDVAKGYQNLEKLVGANTVKLPENPDDKAWGDVWNKLGRPESPDKYKFDNKSGLEFDADSLKEFNQLAHAEGFTQKQYEKAMELYTKNVKAITDGIQQSIVSKANEDFEKCDKALKEKWGNDHAKRVEGAREVAQKFGIVDLLTQKNLDNDPQVIEMLDSLRSMMSDDTIKKTGTTAQPNKEQRLQEIMASKAFVDAMHPDHKKIMQEYLSLHGVKRG